MTRVTAAYLQPGIMLSSWIPGLGTAGRARVRNLYDVTLPRPLNIQWSASKSQVKVDSNKRIANQE